MINPHNFVKNHPIFKNKGLFYAKFCQDLQEIFFILQKKQCLGSGTQELVLGQVGLKDLQSYKCRTLYPIFVDKASFYAEFSAAENVLPKYQNMPSARGLEPKN